MYNQRKKACFTLIELLVVISIIAVLASLLMPAAKTVWGKGKATRAQADISSLKTAVKQFETTYGYFPAASADTGNSGFLDTLTGSDTSTNKRGIQFLETRSDGTFVDPWDRPYYVVMDNDYNNEVSANGDTLNTSVAVWSMGPDGTGNTDDDIESWQ